VEAIAMSNTFSHLLYHVVFSTKERAQFLTPPIHEGLGQYFGGILRSRSALLLAAGGMPDHVHLLVRLRADLAVAVAVRLLKANSSRWLREEPNRLRDFAWQRGYGAFSVSASQAPTVRRYIAQQEAHHRHFSLAHELERLRLRSERSP
jgi:putative transposase